MKRDKIQTILEILETLRERKCSKTRVVYRTNLNFHSAGRYLDRLIEKKMVSLDEQSRQYAITPVGLEMLKSAKSVMEAMS